MKTKTTINYKDMNDRHLRGILQKDIVLDLGGGSPWKTGWIHRKYKNSFEDKAYCVDCNRSKRPHIIADIQNLPFRDNCIDGIICNAVLEHIPEPHKAVNEIHRILKPGGEAFVYVPFLFVFHSEQDYFRFTDKAITFLFKDFDEIIMQPGLDGMGVAVVSMAVLNHQQLSNILKVLLGKPLNLLYKLMLYFYLGIIKKESNIGERVREMCYLRGTHGYHILARK